VRVRSLKRRLLVLGGITIGIALLVAAAGMAELFGRYAERRAVAELDTYIKQISAGVSFDANGVMAFKQALPDPRFGEPLSGLYWQIEDETSKQIFRSRSLWDWILLLPVDQLEPGKVHLHRITGPSGGTLLARERSIAYNERGGPHHVRISAALDMREILTARAEFKSDAIEALALLGIALMAAAWAQISLGLKPLTVLRESVLAVRWGKAQRIEVSEPQEVMPLVAAVNSLLDAQAEAMETAKDRAASLAHGLKTPLTILVADAAKLRESGAAAVAAEIEELADTMRRHIDRELSRVRLESARSLQIHETRARPVIAKLVGALGRTPKGEELEWRIRMDEGVTVPVREDDLAELVGNLLDNACKWANSSISISARTADGTTIAIEDDGPGAPDAFVHRLGERGVRLDEQVPGSGFGLAIANDVAKAYGGVLSFANAKPHGFRATVHFPAHVMRPAAAERGAKA
jgi:signal transduction histidine kinase